MTTRPDFRAPARGDDAARAMRVLFLTGFPAIGGPLPKLAPIMVKGLRRDGCDVEVLGWSAHSAGREPAVAKAVERSTDLMRVLRSVRAWRPDVVYVATTNNWHALARDVPLALALSREKLPFVLHFHGSECGRFGQSGQRAFTALSVWLAQLAAAVLLLSTEERDAWERFCPRARFEVVVNPFVATGGEASTEQQVRLSSRRPTLLFVGRLVRDKGIFELLDALSIVRRRSPCRLVIAGSGPVGDDVVRRVDLLGLSDDVDILGYVTGDDLDAAYANADVFVLPSYREGFPLVVMEAMSYGLPVVTTPIRGCLDHLVPDVNVVFAPPRDVEALADALTRLVRDNDLRERIGAANRVKVREFAPGVVMPRYLEILRSVASGSGGGGW